MIFLLIPKIIHQLKLCLDSYTQLKIILDTTSLKVFVAHGTSLCHSTQVENHWASIELDCNVNFENFWHIMSGSFYWCFLKSYNFVGHCLIFLFQRNCFTIYWIISQLIFIYFVIFHWNAWNEFNPFTDICVFWKCWPFIFYFDPVCSYYDTAIGTISQHTIHFILELLASGQTLIASCLQAVMWQLHFSKTPFSQSLNLFQWGPRFISHIEMIKF